MKKLRTIFKSLFFIRALFYFKKVKSIFTTKDCKIPKILTWQLNTMLI